MKQGIGLLRESGPDAIAAALICFDSAMELRCRLPIDAVPGFRYGLSACWLNRAEALMRSGDAAHISLALAAYEKALGLLRMLPLEDDARFIARLVIALQNHGLALCARGGSAAAGAAIAAFTEALAVLEDDQAMIVARRHDLMAAVLVNLANARASEATRASDALARDAAHRAIALVTEREVSDADAAERGLKARHVLCRSIARHLSEQDPGCKAIPADVHDATDLVDDGLGLVRSWEQKGVGRFREIAVELFRFGATVYETYQPHFLSEFVRENVDPRQSSADYVKDVRRHTLVTLSFVVEA
jgi:hypothetical protein